MIVTDHYQDVSLSQWLALTPPAIVKAHLNVSDATIAHMSKTKQVVV
jgi:oxalate decarboxylase/phosphoglucose isomerase-like protein (cupin superfamily)